MRKKSHISLARYMVENLKDEELKHHKFSFYLGSILPDIKPSFLYKRHEMDGTFPYVSRHIRRLSEGDALIRKKKGCKYYRDLGQISHYLADYFTFPHNANYPGNIKDHCIYEEELKKELRAYVHSPEAVRRREKMEMHTPADILAMIRQMHNRYLQMESVVKRDCQYIIELCHKVVDAVLCFLESLSAAKVSVAM